MEIKDSGTRRTFETGAVRDMAEGKGRELWKSVVGYEGLYEVSNMGRVRSLVQKTRIKDKETMIMRQKDDGKGYFRVNLHKNGKMKAELVHRLVAIAFIDNPNGLELVGHDDDNKKNNIVENLYWTDYRENNHHNGKMNRIHEIHNRKINQIAEALSTPVIGTNIKTGEEINFKSMQEAQRNGFQNSKISLCCSGQRKTHKGYTWRKAE